MESVDGRTVAQPKPRQKCVCKRRGGLFCCLSIFSYMVPASRLVNVDARENIPNWFVLSDCRLVGSLLFQVLAVEGVMACVDDA